MRLSDKKIRHKIKTGARIAYCLAVKNPVIRNVVIK